MRTHQCHRRYSSCKPPSIKGSLTPPPSKISRAGTPDYPMTYNISADMESLRTLSTQLASASSSQTVKVIEMTDSQINAEGGMNITSDNMFVVVNIKVASPAAVNLNVQTVVDGVTLQAYHITRPVETVIYGLKGERRAAFRAEVKDGKAEITKIL